LGATVTGGWLVMGGDAATVGGCVVTGVVAVGVVGGNFDGAVAGAWALNPSRQLRLSKVITQNIVAMLCVNCFVRDKRKFVSYLLAI